MPNTPLNPDALEEAAKAARANWSNYSDWDRAKESTRNAYRDFARAAVSAYLTAAQSGADAVTLGAIGLMNSDWGAHLRLSSEDSTAIAEVVLTAARPRTVETVEQLLALPIGSVIIDDDEVVMQKLPDGEGGTYWVATGDNEAYGEGEITIPSLVLHAPTKGGGE